MVVRNNYVAGTGWAGKELYIGVGWVNGGDPKLVRALPYRAGQVPDLHPMSGSPLIGAGYPLPSVTNDFNGRPRLAGQKPTIGAFQEAAAIH
jgi:hypothetical protein